MRCCSVGDKRGGWTGKDQMLLKNEEDTRQCGIKRGHAKAEDRREK